MKINLGKKTPMLTNAMGVERVSHFSIAVTIAEGADSFFVEIAHPHPEMGKSGSVVPVNWILSKFDGHISKMQTFIYAN